MFNQSRQLLGDIRREGAQDFADANIAQKAMLGVTACGLGFEWGGGNELILGTASGHVLDHTNNALLTALAGGGASFVEQSTLGVIAAISVHSFPRVMDTVKSRFSTFRQSPPTESSNTAEGEPDTAPTSRRATLGGRFITAFTFGTTVTTIKNNGKEQRTLGQDVKDIEIDAALIGGGVATIAAAAAGATILGRAYGLQEAADIFIDVIENPLTYLGLFGVKTLSSLAARRKKAQSQTT